MLLHFLNGCKEPDSVGLNVLPNADLSAVNTSDTFSLENSIVREDSILSGGTSLNLLGALSENVFGYSNASFYSQVLLNSSGVSFGSATFDSIILRLDYAGYYGDLSSAHVFTVYRLTESILDSIYYSNKIFSTSDVLGTFSASEIKPSDSVVIGGINTDPHLRIPLDSSLGAEFLTAPSGNFTDNTAFLNFFKGIYVRDSVTSGSGCVLYFDLKKAMSKLTLYYNHGSSYDFLLNGSGRVNHFEHNYTTAVFGNNFPASGNNFCYVQSMSGVKTKIDLPFLSNLNQDGIPSINKAELIITLDNSSTSTYAANPNLFLVGIDSAGKSYFLPDYIESQTGFGGTLTSGAYTFQLSRYIQQVLTGSRNNYGLYLVSTGAAVNAYRTVVGGFNPPTIRMKLKLSYTHLN